MISPRRSLRLPITLAISMIVMLVALIVGWILVIVWRTHNTPYAPLFWTLLPVGTTFLVLVLGGTICYLVLSIKAINLNRRQSNFIASVTHELKSPIASLKLYLQTLGRHHVNEQERNEFRQYMLEDVERLDHLINHLLDAAQLEKRHVESETVEDVDLAALLLECTESVCLRYRVPLDTIRLDAEPCIVRAARMEIDMIFRNLLDNAVKYAGSTPRVVVTVRIGPEAKTVLTHIRDNGQGIPPQLRRKIFGRFERLGLELERKKSGTGLGLHIVRTLVRRLSGRVTVTSADDGPGTIFEVRLPGLPSPEIQPLPKPSADDDHSAAVTWPLRSPTS